MANATCYTFSKRSNSTKTPTGTGTVIDVALKGGSDILAPVFVLALNSLPDISYISYGGRMYFVTGIKNVRNDLWEIECQVDVLGTYKSEIQATSAYVLYYTHSNTQIVDTRLSTKTDITIQSDTEQFSNLGSGDSYLITTVAMEDGSGDGGTSIFACDKSTVDSLFDDNLITLIQDDYNTNVNNITNALAHLSLLDVQQTIRDVATLWFNHLKFMSRNLNTALYSDESPQYVKNCFVLPIDKSHIGGTSKNIRLGCWDSSASGNKGFPRICHDSATLSIPWQATDWRKNSPYHEIYLYIPYVGLVNIPASEVMNVTNITVNVAVDTYSGVATFVVNADNGTVLGQYSTNIAAPYAIGSSNIDIVNSGAQIVAGAASLFAGFVTANSYAIGGGALGVVNAIKALDGSIGSNGGAAGMGLGNTVKCFTVYHDTTVSPSSVSAVKGTPYNGVMSLSGVSGYVQTSGASVAGSMTDTEREQINQMMDGGIYIE